MRLLVDVVVIILCYSTRAFDDDRDAGGINVFFIQMAVKN